jgi:serine/threonine-protein kinase
MVMPASASERVGRYRLLGELGQGGTATVWVAVASGPAGFSKLVVLKKMKAHFATEPGFAEMFLTEARLAARLNHPNIVQTNEVFDENGLPVIVMEYLEGKSLADISVARRPDSEFTLHHYLAAVSEALSGLHYSHELTDYKGRPLELVHRDVTPHNVFVTYEGQVKILDFGIAKLRNSTVETETGIVKGKLRYIPPEQIIGEDVDRRADIYSVGVMLWEAAVGEKMWRGLGDAAVMNRVINEEIPRPREKNPDVDPRLERLIMKALAPDPRDRHQTAQELQRDLDDVRSKLGSTLTSRDLAPALVAMFSGDRSKTRELIQMRLAEGSQSNAKSSVPPPRTSRTSMRPYATKAASKRNLHKVWLLLAATVGLLVWLVVRETRSPGAGVGASATASISSGSAPAPQRRQVRFTAFPSNAEMLVDGSLVDGNPYSTELPGDEAPHEVTVTAPGYQSLTRSFSLRTDVDIVFRLTPEGSAAGASTGEPPTNLPPPKAEVYPQPVRLRAEAPPPVPPPANTTHCSPPYVVDTRGIKRFKPECVR